VARMAANDYGKSGIRLTKVVRGADSQSLIEMRVDLRLGGDFEGVYTRADNSLCIPTDTMKNTVYVLAREHDIDSPEAFAGIVAAHFVERFSHVDQAEVGITQTLWTRIIAHGAPHAHAFARAGTAERTGLALARREGPPSVSGGFTDLKVLKTTGSGFSGFLKDPYTTLRETSDRILATSIDATWQFSSPHPDYNGVAEKALRVIPETFALHDSASAQHTLFAMGESFLAAAPEVASVSLRLPNEHRLLVDLGPFHLANENVIFVATSEPHGVITGTVGRE
jgi:urate oxidase